MEKLQNRKSKPATFNLDMNLIGDYWYVNLSFLPACHIGFTAQTALHDAAQHSTAQQRHRYTVPYAGRFHQKGVEVALG